MKEDSMNIQQLTPKERLVNDIKNNPYIHREYLFFWREYTKGQHEVTQTCLSQWFPRSFQDQEGTVYQTAEHYMMAHKALHFGDHESFRKILNASTPKEAKALGRGVCSFNVQAWNKVKFEIVIQGNLLKFGQHPDLKTFLLHTQDQIIVEASPFDKIWGIGLRKEDRHARRPSKWKGENLLGFALMDVRDRLKSL